MTREELESCIGTIWVELVPMYESLPPDEYMAELEAAIAELPTDVAPEDAAWFADRIAALREAAMDIGEWAPVSRAVPRPAT